LEVVQVLQLLGVGYLFTRHPEVAVLVRVAGGLVLAGPADAAGQRTLGIGVDGGQVAVFEFALRVGAVDAFPAPAISFRRIVFLRGVRMPEVFLLLASAPLPALDFHIPNQALGAVVLFTHQQQRLLRPAARVTHQLLALTLGYRSVRVEFGLDFPLNFPA